LIRTTIAVLPGTDPASNEAVNVTSTLVLFSPGSSFFSWIALCVRRSQHPGVVQTPGGPSVRCPRVGHFGLAGYF
jgi:hypothetical protein